MTETTLHGCPKCTSMMNSIKGKKLYCEKCGYSITEELYLKKWKLDECNTCGRVGHASRQCWKTKTCDTCGKSGHIAERCLTNVQCVRCGLLGHTDYYCRTPTCGNCQEIGHRARFCRTQICKICGEQGHEAFDCRDNKPEEISRGPCTRCQGEHSVEQCPKPACEVCAMFPPVPNVGDHYLESCTVIRNACPMCFVTPKLQSDWLTHNLEHCTGRLLFNCRNCGKRGHAKIFCNIWSKVKSSNTLIERLDHEFAFH